MKIKIISLIMLFLIGITTVSYACGGCCSGSGTKTPGEKTTETAGK